MPRLSLDCLTLTDTAPDQLVRAAAGAGFDLVSLWVAPPIFPRQGLSPANCDAVAAAMAETGIGVHVLEVFDLVSDEVLEGYRPALELGAGLGGKVATAIHMTNPDRTDAVRLLRRFAGIAAEYGLGVGLEPIVVGETRTLAEGAALIAEAGIDAGLTFDFLHLMRCGGSAGDVRAIDPALIRYVQVCDGKLSVPPEYLEVEGALLRLFPGEGEFPIAELLAAAPEHAIIGVECPNLARIQAGADPIDLAHEAMAAIRAFIG
ncbi:MAG TPA: sugar phosphate isomerase/epimerase [Novosphingobium sp.]|nr:sugar phosphate isomerase/epimerase [Novosphingobium sp.]